VEFQNPCRLAKHHAAKNKARALLQVATKCANQGLDQKQLSIDRLPIDQSNSGEDKQNRLRNREAALATARATSGAATWERLR
jgi:hypothetical protein